MNIYSKRLPTIKQLQYFLAVCEESSFREAAIKLSISQPPLSIQIKELEEKLGMILFLRNTRGVILTRYGEEFMIAATTLLTSLCLITNKSKASSADNKCIVGMTNTLNFDFIPIFKAFLSDFSSEIIVYKNKYTSKELLGELQKGNIDFSLMSYSSVGKKNENFQLIYQEPMILALPENHIASVNQFLDLNDVLDLPLFWFNRSKNPAYYDQCERVFKILSKPLTRRPEFADTLSMLFDISLGKGMALLPKSMAQVNISGVTYKKLLPYYEKKLLIDIFLVWIIEPKKASLLNKLINYFLK